MMLHVNHFFWAEPHNHHSSHKVAAVVLILLDLGLEALESNNFTDKRSIGEFGSSSIALCPPIHRENGVSSQTSRVHGISARGFALYETKTLTFTQGRPC